MPNPFTRFASTPNRSTDPVERTRPHGAIDPVPEKVAGPVFAYRGQQTHGVPTDRDATSVDADMYDAEAEYEPDYLPMDAEPEPIPVRIVQGEQSVEVLRSVLSRMTATGTDRGGQAAQIIGNDFLNRSRTIVRIKNVGTDIIYIAPTPELANSMFGYPLAANETFECRSYEAWYAKGTVATETPVSVYSEFSSNTTHDKAPRGRRN